MTLPLRHLTCAALLLAALHAPAEASRPRIVFSCWIPTDVPIFQQLVELYREAFGALGYDFEMHHRPNQRSLMEANAGTTDGECARAVSFPQGVPAPNLVRVDTQIASTSLEAWSNDPDLRLSQIQDLNTGSYRIGYVRGHVIVNGLMERFPELALTSVTGTEQGLKMLSVGRLDLFIGTSISTRQKLEKVSLPQPIYSAGRLMVLKGHPYLNRQHQALADDLAAELEKRLPEGGWQFD